MSRKSNSEKIDEIIETLGKIQTEIAVIKTTNCEFRELQNKCDIKVNELECEAAALKAQMNTATGIGIGIGIVATLLSILAGAKAFGIW